MNTSVTTKFAALALALFANTVLLGGVAYLFNVHAVQSVPVARTSITHAVPVA